MRHMIEGSKDQSLNEPNFCLALLFFQLFNVQTFNSFGRIGENMVEVGYHLMSWSVYVMFFALLSQFHCKDVLIYMHSDPTFVVAKETCFYGNVHFSTSGRLNLWRHKG